ncbi:hypothetical protein [Polymorphobacter sp.]|uniref:hypothetical protein n=1 Tax=Polymorphobacter sp. TaxID=1909290 RepID=UPI003F716A37
MVLAAMVLGLSSGPAAATLMVGADMPPAAQPSPEAVRLADADAAAIGARSDLTDLEAGGMLLASLVFSVMLWRGVRPGR